ncbi:MAG: hypothetical protein J6X24_05125, partial [Firmicutes bacterium]|nr:hypothetical protein [Bacillota bacterium]
SSPEVLAPYMTEDALRQLKLDGLSEKLEQRCQPQADSWRIIMIRIDETPAPGSFGFWADLQGEKDGEAVLESFGGSYTVDENGSVSAFFTDLQK